MDKWAFLTPWWRALRTHELVVCTRHRGLRDELHALSVSSNPESNYSFGQPGFHTPTTEEKIQAFYTLRDATELVLLLAVVDPSAFSSVVSAHVDWSVEEDAPLDAARVLEFHEDKPPSHVELRFRLHCYYDDQVDLMVDALRVFVTPQPLHERDLVFQDARRRLLELIPLNETDKRSACENLKVSVSVADDEKIMPLRLLRLQEASTATAAMAGREPPMYPFVAGGFTLLIAQRTFTRKTSTQIALWPKRDESDPYDRVRISAEDWRSLKQFGMALSASLLPPQLDGTNSSNRSAEVSMGDMSDPVRFAQVCSALLCTRAMQSLRLALSLRYTASDHDRRLRLRWFVFVVFSRWATHNLKHLWLDDIKLADEEVEDLLQFLRCENPLTLLFSDSNSDETELAKVPARQVLAREGAEVELDLPPTRLKDGGRETILLSEETWLNVISEDTQDVGGNWLVLVPAYGKCRLRREDTLRVRPTEVSGPFVKKGLTSLSIYASVLRTEKGHGVAAFLRGFCRPLEVLQLQYLPSQEFDAFLEDLANCRSLKCLGASIDSAILPHLVDAYETGALKAVSLDLRLRHQTDSPNVLKFFESLADPTQRISRTLRELIILCWAFDPHIPVAEVAAMQKMLENNSTLQYFDRRCQPVHNEAFVELCHTFNNARHVAATPLERRSKSAFLSCVWTDKCSTSARIQLDNVMVTRIFELAAEPVMRRAVVSRYNQVLYGTIRW